ncbi:MAG: Hpt domain-containing protein [Gammaproteobacteria bacterium]|nr:Hpt domain-containing protein [Gammaproteobacteria bacterium]MCW9055793.1 Hpt domain-containing protein [Gammaproteobacteria bacterium]
MGTDENIFELDADIIKDFLDEYLDAYEELERTFAEAESGPDNSQLINKLFRSVHSIKSNLRMVALDDLSAIIHVLENTLDDIRHNKLQYIPELSQLILTVINQVRELASLQLQDRNSSEDIMFLSNAITELNQTNNNTLEQTITSILNKIDPDGGHQITNNIDKTSTNSLYTEDDLDFFIEVSQQIESFFPHWSGRNKRILDICLKINTLASHPVDIKQLTAAVYAHDIGMSFIPYNILIMPLPLSCDDELVLREHCHLGYQWIKRIPGWEAATEMVFQHHERSDGNGYPQGLKQDEISDGAKIIAIVDTFEALTHERNHREEIKTPMQAIMEINSNSGTQFDSQWIELFNQVIKNKSA